MLHCRHCQEGLPAQAAFCESCGQAVVGAEGPKSQIYLEPGAVKRLLSHLGQGSGLDLEFRQGQLQARSGNHQFQLAPIQLEKPTRLTWTRGSRVLEIQVEKLELDGQGLRIDFALDQPQS